jgi:sulfatase modifying factor 1
MTHVHDAPDAFCMDRWEAHVVEVADDGRETAHSPYAQVEGLRIRAKSAPGVVPQGYVSQVSAARACAEAGKRLCTQREFVFACRGATDEHWYPYGGKTREAGKCNEDRFSAVQNLFGANANNWTYSNFNDPRLNQMEGGLAKTGAHPKCVSRYGAFDMVGNLHEWIDAPIDPRTNTTRFVGGSYGDAEKNGPGCLYVTSVHEAKYHDYSTGFRCCKDAVE